MSTKTVSKVICAASLIISNTMSSSSSKKTKKQNNNMNNNIDIDMNEIENALKKNNININECDLNEPWLCSEFSYYESHTCTLNNVCIFNEYSFINSGDFQAKMTHHCNNLPFDCNYFQQIKTCRTKYCATNDLCDFETDGYDLCLIKALLCYDEYCEPDLSSLPFDYRLYDLCCHINAIGM